MDKKTLRLFVFLAILTTGFFACDEQSEGAEKRKVSSLAPSSGKYGELVVVVDTFYQSRRTGKALKEMLLEPVPGLPQPENKFRVSFVPSNAFKSILRRSRNILKLSVGKGKKAAISVDDDVWARDQLVIRITAGNDREASEVIEANKTAIVDYFNEKELERLKKQYSIKPEKDIVSFLEERFELTLIVPPGFVQMADTVNGVWFKKEKTIGQHQVLQGITVNVRNYESDSVFYKKEMIHFRNEFTVDMVQGTREGSFMKVYEGLPIEDKELNLNEVYAKEYRGLWNMENDFMGGPFIHYTLVDEKRNRVIELDGFVYAPKFDKREYLREVEAILRTFSLK